MTMYTRVGRPSYIGSRKQEVEINYNKLYGEGNWRFAWDIQGNTINLDGALLLYEDAYFEYFKKHSDELQWIANNFSDVYDNNISNVHSGLDYHIQEFGGNHFQDIAIRRCLVRNLLRFKGKELLEIRTAGLGKQYNPSEIQFHKPELIPQPEIKGWWKPHSLESWYQSAKYLEAKNVPFDTTKLHFITSNTGKFEGAKRALATDSIERITLEIHENQDTVQKIAQHKASVAYSVLCCPVLCDDSGFSIPSLADYPAHRVKRELDTKGITHFLELARQKPLESYFIQALSYKDESLAKPELFISKVEGILIGEQRGDSQKPFLKSPLGTAFILKGHTKTIAEMSEEEYKQYAVSNRWTEFKQFLHQHNPALLSR